MKKIFLSLLIFYSAVQAQTESLITALHLEKHTITYSINNKLKEQYLTDDFFVTYQDDIDLTQLDYTIVTMPLILNIISVIWISGENYTIPAMDRQLYESLETVHQIFKLFYPATSWEGNLIPLTLVDNANPKTQSGIMLPFSHGLDSVAASYQYYDLPQLLFTVRGFPDVPLASDQDDKWEQAQKLVIEFATTHGHANAFAYSNFHDFFNWKVLNNISPEISQWRVDTVEDLGWMGLAAPIMVSKGYSKLVIASGHGWEAPHPRGGCPIIDSNVFYAEIENESALFDLQRLERNRLVAKTCKEHNIKKPLILVCERQKELNVNCCKCQKCVITILSFLLIQEDPKNYGFTIETSEFLSYFRNHYYYKNRYAINRALWFKYCQEEALRVYDSLDPKLQEFCNWFTTIDFDALALPNGRIKINTKDFIYFYDKVNHS